MKKLYAVIAIIVIALSLFYLSYQQATAQHQRELQVCTEKFEQIRADAAKIESVRLYPFQKHRWNYVWVSNFDGGLAAFSGTREDRERRGFVDFNGNVVLEHQGAHIDGLNSFGGFKDGRTEIFVYAREALPWGFLLPQGNSVPKFWGTLDCTGKVTLER